LDFSGLPDGIIGMRTIEDNALLLLTIAISLAFAWILLPFYGAVLWGTVTAILFSPLYRRLLKSMEQRRTLAALSTVMIIISIVILPITLIAASLTQEALGFYGKVQSGELGHSARRLVENGRTEDLRPLAESEHRGAGIQRAASYSL
jgi:predicted PurR-regulated permease PerM